MKRYLSVIAAALCIVAVVAFTTGCDSEPVLDEQYVKVSDVQLTFMGEGSEGTTVTVYSNPGQWTISEPGAVWAKVGDVGPNTFVVMVEDNPDTEARSTVLTVSAGQAVQEVRVFQMGRDYVFPRYSLKEEYQFGTAISLGGVYAGGFYARVVDGVRYDHVEITNLLTGEVSHNVYTGLTLWAPSTMTDAGELHISQEGGPTLAFYPDGTYEQAAAGGSQCSADGRVYVGYYSENGVSSPVKTVDGVRIPLPKPEKNYRGGEIGDVQARGCSADGSIIYGTTWDNRDFGMIYWDLNGDVHYVGEDQRNMHPEERDNGYGTKYTYMCCDGMWTSATNNNCSPNGRYIAGTYRVESISSDGTSVDEVNYPAFFNTETLTTTIFWDMPGCAGVTASSDGLGFTADSTVGPNSGDVVDIENGTVLCSAVEWVKETYGINIPSGYVYYKPDNGTVLGATLATGGPTMEGVHWFITEAR